MGSGRSVLPRRYPALSKLVDQNSASWNQIAGWLRQLDLIRAAA
jgi:hypothetical protein